MLKRFFLIILFLGAFISSFSQNRVTKKIEVLATIDSNSTYMFFDFDTILNPKENLLIINRFWFKKSVTKYFDMLFVGSSYDVIMERMVPEVLFFKEEYDLIEYESKPVSVLIDSQKRKKQHKKDFVIANAAKQINYFKLISVMNKH